ncbi:N-6 DNA methylase [Pseudanabaena sp. FACHB-1998]|uniref:restriction endonuclease subunit M n=1 Tax=Pseudanabaena sp. FACHB-1998 TaxID=2692858 RepID=UPI001680C166|nr:N-6 DNA methylase [Pseudanabaena sp. FACHB-1998]MBD2179241.1 N-6 DNA methylase [Pseudanabaena sp. FACHB-1998]
MSKDKFTEEERIAFYNAISHLDPNKIYVNYNKDADTLSYTKQIHSYENISGKPSDEEITRALIILHLINTYGYNSDRIEIENTFSIGGRRDQGARAVETDICIKNEKDEIEILCEVKRIQNYLGTDDSSIRKQLFEPFENVVKYSKSKYLFHLAVDVPIDKDHFPLNCVGIDTAVSKTYREWENQGKTPHFIDLITSGERPQAQDAYIKLAGDEENLDKKVKDLNDNFGIDQIQRVWRQLWDHIWGGTLEDNKKFENFNKVLLAKIYDERKTNLGTPYSFQKRFVSGKPQSESELANNIDLLYRKAFREYLSKDKSIELFSVKGIDFREFPISLVSKCVEYLQGFSFQKNRYKNVDILGEFYEMVIRGAFKQTKGLFLTHPNIVLFILSVLEVDRVVESRLRKPDEDNRYRLPFVIDPSCGTGTFLVHYMHYVQKFINKNHKRITGGDEDVKDFIERHVLDKNAYKWVIDYVYGIDKEAVLATACQINLILHGDGSTNIYNADGLSGFKDYGKMEVTGAVNILSSNISDESDYYSKQSINKFDFIISNPPFNVNIDKNEIQSNFEIKGKSEAYFLERWYQLLKEDGRIGVVLPESFFSVEDDIAGRFFLYKHFKIKAIVSLPSHAFQPHTPTNTSLLFASKKTKQEEEDFNALWIKFESEFVNKSSKITSILPSQKSKVNFEDDKVIAKNNIKKILEEVEKECLNEFAAGFVVLPFFEEGYIFNDENYTKIKKSINDVLQSLKKRWILHKVASIQKIEFYNFSVDEIGYKAGKKGSKDKPNELLSVFGSDSKKIYNIKYSHSWDKIDEKDIKTVLGKIKELKIW